MRTRGRLPSCDSKLVIILVSIIFMVVILPPGMVGSPATAALAGGEHWSPPRKLSSGTAGLAWFPDIATDGQGVVHVVWAEQTGAKGGEKRDTVVYSRWDGREWSLPNDIGVSPLGWVTRPALAADPFGYLHLVRRDKDRIVYSTAPAERASSAGSWTAGTRITEGNDGYISDVVVDRKGTVHVVWTEGSGTCATCVSIRYKRSETNGRSWSPVTTLSRELADRHQLQVSLDAQDVLHVVWENVTEQGMHTSASYVSSKDGGETWTNRTTIEPPSGTSAEQPAVAADGKGNVVLVFRTKPDDLIYYRASTDGGKTWSASAPVPGVVARSANYPGFDMYDMAVDSAGTAHLVVAGRLSSADTSTGIFHLEWQGNQWSAPHKIAEGPGEVEYPKIAVSEGNKLHVVWFTRDLVWTQEGASYAVWYSSSESDATRVAPTMPLARPAPVGGASAPVLAGPPTAVPVLTDTGTGRGITVPEKEPNLALFGIIPAGSVLAVFLFLRLWQRVRS